MGLLCAWQVEACLKKWGIRGRSTDLSVPAPQALRASSSSAPLLPNSAPPVIVSGGGGGNSMEGNNGYNQHQHQHQHQYQHQQALPPPSLSSHRFADEEAAGGELQPGQEGEDDAMIRELESKVLRLDEMVESLERNSSDGEYDSDRDDADYRQRGGGRRRRRGAVDSGGDGSSWLAEEEAESVRREEEYRREMRLSRGSDGQLLHDLAGALAERIKTIYSGNANNHGD
jgi:hypothetical protein